MNLNMKKIIYLTFLLLLFNIKSIDVVANTFDFDGIDWISIDLEDQKPNQWLCFRKVFSINEAIPEKVDMDLAVDSKFWLWINDKLVVFEGGLKRGPNPEDTYYDSVDISDYLKKGDNVIAILVWFWGKDGFCHKDSGKSCLLARIQIRDDLISSDASWKVRINPAFGETGNPKPNYRLPESNVCYDARLSLGNWQELNYDDDDWNHASVIGTYPCSPWNKLHQRPFPNWKDSGIIKYDKIYTFRKNDTITVAGLLPKNITVTPYIKVKAPEGRVIDIRSDNYKGGSEYNVRAEYITRNGVQEFEMPNYINGHKIYYTFPKDVKLLKVGYRETRFNTEHIGSFKCNDEFYNKLWEKSLNTMNLNMRDAIQDPDRERSQWWGDAAIISNEIYYSCDENGLDAVKKAILNLVDWQKDDGTLYSPVPAGSWDKELPLQMLASIGRYGFWNYYVYTKDINTIKHIYPKVKKYLSLWSIDENGLVKHRSGGWDWADWGENIDVDVLDNAWYCIALESAINMARLLGDEKFIDYYSSQLKLVKDSAIKEFWNGNCFRSPRYSGITDDRANGLAMLAGFTDEKMNQKIADLLNERMGASPYMEKYILEALFSKGYTKEALSRMKKRYANMVESKLSTLWEDWTIGGAGGGSINHGWAGGALSLLPQYVAGIAPYTPGWEMIIIKPQLGNLRWVECSVPIQNRTVDLKVTQSENGLYEIAIVNNSSSECIVAFPKEKIINDTLKLNNTILSLSDYFHTDQNHKANIKVMENKNYQLIDFLKEGSDYLYFRINDDSIVISNQ